ncbi:hypothetical protein AcW1_009370 [Taiwanofungus camphoratus]|nr:hypothetical protein AcV5_003440 [Antrodia cinnamomea]KAI0935036.1 hypothetical protein AcV7_003950 [Antrodia cinnamomea]KAI0947669.1 hypothetical protein AcW1_009370 [Antrodia cinnamomea]
MSIIYISRFISAACSTTSVGPTHHPEGDPCRFEQERCRFGVLLIEMAESLRDPPEGIRLYRAEGCFGVYCKASRGSSGMQTIERVLQSLQVELRRWILH